MRRLGWVIVTLASLAGVAHADDVNLLISTPTTVAVSSTVANAAILPEHVVDGKLSTAWNSQTGELAGAWIAVRVPADARVKSVKLTAGFVHKHKKLGDLFTLNPRIKKVRISQAGKTLVEKALDIDNRGLQEIAVDIAGGDFEVRVLEVVPGKRKNWREACVSELEVWGSVPKVVKSKPSVRIRSLDAAPTLTRQQCIKAVGNDVSGKVTNVEALPFSDAIVICRVDRKETDSTETTIEIAAVKRTPKPTLIAKIEETTTTEDRSSEGAGDTGSVELAFLPLTTSEKALVVHVSQSKYGPMMDVGTRKSKLVRVSPTSLDEVLAYESTWDNGEATESDTCELAPFTVGKSMPNLVLECATEVGHWHDENPDDRGIDRKERKARFRWTNGRYEPK